MCSSWEGCQFYASNMLTWIYESGYRLIATLRSFHGKTYWSQLCRFIDHISLSDKKRRLFRCILEPVADPGYLRMAPSAKVGGANLLFWPFPPRTAWNWKQNSERGSASLASPWVHQYQCWICLPIFLAGDNWLLVFNAFRCQTDQFEPSWSSNFRLIRINKNCAHCRFSVYFICYKHLSSEPFSALQGMVMQWWP